jgi:hypothetical protein
LAVLAMLNSKLGLKIIDRTISVRINHSTRLRTY